MGNRASRLNGHGPSPGSSDEPGASEKLPGRRSGLEVVVGSKDTGILTFEYKPTLIALFKGWLLFWPMRERMEMPDTDDELIVTKEGDITLVQFRERKIIDELQIQRIGERLRDMALAERSPKMVLDFAAVEYLSSRALSELISLSRQVDQRGGQLALAGIHPQIYEVFKITRLNRLFRIEDKVEDALKVLT